MGRISHKLLLVTIVISSTKLFAETCITEGTKTACMSWSKDVDPIHGIDFITDFTDTGDGLFPSIELITADLGWQVWVTSTQDRPGAMGSLTCPHSGNFDVLMFNPVGNFGAMAAKSIELIPIDGYSNLNGIIGKGLEEGNLTLIEYKGEGGVINFHMVGHAGDIQIPYVKYLSMGTALGETHIKEILPNGYLLMGDDVNDENDAVAGCLVDWESPPVWTSFIQIDTISSGGSFQINDHVAEDVVISSMTDAYFGIMGSVFEDVNIIIDDILGSSTVVVSTLGEFGCDFQGQLHLNNGIPSDARVKIFAFTDNGSSDIFVNGDLSGELSSRFSLGSNVYVTNIPDIFFDGSIRIHGDLNGDIQVEGCHATNEDLDICVDGQINGDINIVQKGCSEQVDSSCTLNPPLRQTAWF